MKSLINTISTVIIIIIAGIFLNACEKISEDNTGKGKLELSLNILSEEGGLKSVSTDTITSTEITGDAPIFDHTTPPSYDTTLIVSTHHILISVLNENGTAVLDDELIPLFNFGGSFISKKLELQAGKYSISKFMVIDPEGKVIFAAPVEGSPKSYLVNKPLPLPFTIVSGSVTRVIPEVLPVMNVEPEEFGYAAFSFQVVKALTFYVMAIIDNDTLIPENEITEIPSPIFSFKAKLTVYAPDNNWKHSFDLNPIVNKIDIRAGSDYYILIGEMEGFPALRLKLTAGELMASSKEKPIILRFRKNPLHVVTIKPGPKEGKDAMITDLDPDKNFGDYPYFEARSMPDPILDVIRSSRSLISFDMNHVPKSARIKRVVLTLYYYPKIRLLDDQGVEKPISDIKPWYGAVLQQIVEPWDEYKVTWNNQPATIEENQVFINPPPTIEENQVYINSFLPNVKYINIDVSRLYIPVNTIQKPHYGMLMKLISYEQFPELKFASSDFPNQSMHPELKVYYTLP